NAITTSADCLNGLQGNIDVTVAGGTTGYSYSWTSGQSTEDITAVAGNYTLTVTDTNGCVTSSPFTINDNSTLTISSTDSVSFCEGDSASLNSSIANGPFQWMVNG